MKKYEKNNTDPFLFFQIWKSFLIPGMITLIIISYWLFVNRDSSNVILALTNLDTNPSIDTMSLLDMSKAFDKFWQVSYTNYRRMVPI